MFRHILIPTDCTPDTLNALDIAVKMQDLNTSEDTKITLLHVIETIADDDSHEFQNFYNSLKQQAQKTMEDFTTVYQDKNMIRHHISFGNRVQEILAFSQNEDVDLIILSSHKIDPNNPTQGWGTISHKVGILSSCPVMLVK
ncbi:MAG TPA: universal stress protein [Desulfohalobiaceae bacterium]|nr:universal stress protein [Desulfohalobiaceae bacterium]